jgi:hypothetical protein
MEAGRLFAETPEAHKENGSKGVVGKVTGGPRVRFAQMRAAYDFPATPFVLCDCALPGPE